MKIKFIISVSTFVMMWTLPFQVQSNIINNGVDSSFYIYLLMGQSNMAGRGEVEGKFVRMKHSRVLMMNKSGKWLVARHPVHFDKPEVAGVGPGLSFGIEMAKAHKKKKIGLVPCAVGGTSIQHWKPGAYDERTDTHPWDDAVIRIHQSMKDGVIKGVIWHQGESDSAPESAAHYLEDLKSIIKLVRDLVGDPELPFVAAQLGHYNSSYENINRALRDLPEAVFSTGVASAEGLTSKEDGVHFDSRSADELGRRLAKKIVGQNESKTK